MQENIENCHRKQKAVNVMIHEKDDKDATLEFVRNEKTGAA